MSEEQRIKELEQENKKLAIDGAYVFIQWEETINQHEKDYLKILKIQKIIELPNMGSYSLKKQIMEVLKVE